MLKIGAYVVGASVVGENRKANGIVISLFRGRGEMRLANTTNPNTVNTCVISTGTVRVNNSGRATKARKRHAVKAP